MLTHTTCLIEKIDPLKNLLRKYSLRGRLEKWFMILSEFNIEYVERKAIKGQTIIDQLVETPLSDYQMLHIEFLDESILHLTHQTWIMFFYGSFTQ